MVPAAVMAAATATARIVGQRRGFRRCAGLPSVGRGGVLIGGGDAGAVARAGGGCGGCCVCWGNMSVPAGPYGTRWAGLSTVSLFASHGSTGRSGLRGGAVGGSAGVHPRPTVVSCPAA